MITFFRPSRCEHPRRAAVVLGDGLVGAAIINALHQRGLPTPRTAPVHWEARERLALQVARIISKPDAYRLASLDWVWAAGRCGFSSPSEETGGEMEAFRGFLDGACRLRDRLGNGCTVRLHLISSAGGLFEGQRQVQPTSVPSPCRPYGILKLAQENEARERMGADSLHSYRLSSVYGFIRARRRVGLISALIGNVLHRKTTCFSGRLDTLRDYIWADDVGAFIAERIGVYRAQPSTMLLASGRPATIFEIRELVQRALRQKTFVLCLGQASNSAHVTFSRSALPHGLRVSSLETNIRRVAADALYTGRVRPAGIECRYTTQRRA